MFRRKQDEEDPFAALKDAAERGSPTVASAKASTSSGNASAAESVGGDRSEPTTTTRVSGIPGTARDRRGSNAFLIFLTIVLALGGAGALVYFSEADPPAGADSGHVSGPNGNAASGDDGTGSGNGSQNGSGDSGKPPPARHYDLLRPATFKQALNGIQKRLKPGERIWLLRLAPDRINANSRLRNGDQRLIDVNDELKVGATQAGSAGSNRGLQLSQIDPQGPARAVRKAAAQGRFSARKLDYLVLMTPTYPGAPTNWSLFFRGVAARNSHWTASLDGRTVHRPGEQSGVQTQTRADSVTIRTDNGTTTLTGADARRVLDCVNDARGDGRSIQECLP